MSPPRLLVVVLLAYSADSAVTDFPVPPEYSDLPYKNWMSYFQDWLVGDIPVIPGSHQSGTQAVMAEEGWIGISGWLYAQNQDLSITAQLELGIRILDIRLYVTEDVFDEPNSIYVSHTFRSNLSLANALSEVAAFLESNPTEFLYLVLRIDDDHVLQEHVETKNAYIQSEMLSSAVAWANVDSEELKATKVQDVAGKVILVALEGVLPAEAAIKYLIYGVHYVVCDVYQYTTLYAARQRIGTCFPLNSPSKSETGILYGFALDGQFDQLWPNITSRDLNDWFFYNFQENPTWVRRRNSSPLGVILFDFVNIEYASVLVDYNMQIFNSGFKGSANSIGVIPFLIPILFALQFIWYY